MALDHVLERAAVDLDRARHAGAGQDERSHDEVVGQRGVGLDAPGDLPDSRHVALDVGGDLLVGAVGQRLGVEALVAVGDVDGQQAADRRAGYRYEPFIWQAEFSLTQVLDRPLSGRVFFEEVIRENLDLGRPDHVALIFDRRITRRTPGWFRTRVITEGVNPSLHLDYLFNRIKQYFKEGRGLRTETTINNPTDFKVPKRLQSLSQLRQIGFRANRRLLDVQKISQDCALGEAAFAKVNQPIEVEDQRVSGLRYGEGRVQALLTALLMFVFVATGFTAKDLRPQLATLMGISPDKLTDLRRLRLHGLIERLPRSHRYRLTQQGIQIALFWTRTYNRLLRPGLAQLVDPRCESAPLRSKFLQLAKAIDEAVVEAKIAA